MTVAVSNPLPAELSQLPTIDDHIRLFLDGENDGELLLNTLYGDTLDEPVPTHLLALLK